MSILSLSLSVSGCVLWVVALFASPFRAASEAIRGLSALRRSHKTRVKQHQRFVQRRSLSNACPFFFKCRCVRSIAHADPNTRLNHTSQRSQGGKREERGRAFHDVGVVRWGEGQRRREGRRTPCRSSHPPLSSFFYTFTHTLRKCDDFFFSLYLGRCAEAFLFFPAFVLLNGAFGEKKREEN